MKKKDFEKKNSKSVTELKKEVSELKRKFVEISAKIAAGREKNPKAGKAIRLEIVKTLSLISRKEREEKGKENQK